MKKTLIVSALLLTSSLSFASSPMHVPEEMMRGRSDQYQQGFRDGFREAMRMMNGGGDFGGNGGSGGNGNSRILRIESATYGYGSSQRCDLTQALAREANGHSNFNFRSGNQWCGNPAYNQAKSTSIRFYCGNQVHTTSVPENRTTTLRCD
ncbi:hypothetical protein [Deefgea rivuli]|uniref:hypothetical protein n=1 Tax=Deefgea rivuli TaxID=400948 RepID=UPI00056965EE|nr:hypothetical protein [Deefgea rivuli]